MRLLFPVLVLPLLVPAATSAQTAAPAAGASPQNTARAILSTGSNCRKTTSYRADGTLAWRDEPMTPKRLTDLPPAESYKAVYRTVNGCEEPMTVAEYQRGDTR
jgi:hypothetical protein